VSEFVYYIAAVNVFGKNRGGNVFLLGQFEP